jgi:hypothetical protein
MEFVKQGDFFFLLKTHKMFLCVLFTAIMVAVLAVLRLLVQFINMLMFVENSALNVMMLFSGFVEVSAVKSVLSVSFFLTCAVSVICLAITETAHE